MVFVSVHAVGLNPVDAKGVVGDKLPHHWTFTHKRVQSYIQNKIIGFDFAGVVAEDDHHAFQRGDKVFGNMPPFEGTLVEYISVPLDQICYMPQNCTFVQASAIPLVGLTGLQSLSPYVPSSSSTTTSVLIIGASGGTGHCALQIARNLGAAHVTAICSGHNAELAKSCGATHVVDYTLNNGNLDTLHKNLRESPGWPFHVVLDCVTSADPRDQIVDYPSLIRRHHLTTAAEPLLVDDHQYLRLGGQTPDWFRAGVERVCFGLSIWPDKHEKLFWIRFPKASHELRQLQEWAQDNKLQIHIEETIPFSADAVQRAFDRILERRVKGKIVVEVVDSK